MMQMLGSFAEFERAMLKNARVLASHVPGRLAA